MKKFTTDEDIKDFLEKGKALIAEGRYDFVPRRKNMQSLARCGMTVKDVKEELLDLVAADYYKGPKADFDSNRPGDIWEFKKKINGIPFYIKVKIVDECGEEVFRCLGFHEDEFA